MSRFRSGTSIAALTLMISACAAWNSSDPAVESESVASVRNPGSAPSATIAAGPEASKAIAQPKVPPEPSFSPAATISKAEQLLADGSELYEKGDFKAAIRKLTAARDSFADTSAEMQTSLKYLAFSYCVTGQRSLCKAQFVALLKIAPDFQLSRAEAGHPLWGPVFKDSRAGSKTSTTAAASPVK